jgi:NAD(P)-dependent dehydrogenase (short-subunit alcohol dehydrogenase family)
MGSSTVDTNEPLLARRILVVGASSGIGAAIARLAGARGARVAVSARRLDRLDELAAGLPGGVAIGGDVRDEVDVRRVIDQAVAAFGGLDAVVYATGVSPLLPMSEATQDDWRAVFDTNVIGAALVGAAAAPHLLASRGRLVILSSKAVRRPFPDLALYSTSKVALDGLIRCLPLEFPGLLVTRVVVGNTAGTDFASSWTSTALDAAVGRWIASGVLGSTATMEPEDVAATVLHVLESNVHIDDVSVIEHGA